MTNTIEFPYIEGTVITPGEANRIVKKTAFADYGLEKNDFELAEILGSRLVKLGVSWHQIGYKIVYRRKTQ